MLFEFARDARFHVVLWPALGLGYRTRSLADHGLNTTAPKPFEGLTSNRGRLTRRCSGLASLAAELHVVRPRWLRQRRTARPTAWQRRGCGSPCPVQKEDAQSVWH